MLDHVGWLSLNQMSCEIRLIEVWKSLNIDNYCLSELFEKVKSNRATRTQNKIRLKTGFSSRLRDSSFQYPSVQIWNAAPSSVTNATSESQARKAIREFVKTLPIWISNSDWNVITPSFLLSFLLSCDLSVLQKESYWYLCPSTVLHET